MIGEKDPLELWKFECGQGHSCAIERVSSHEEAMRALEAALFPEINFLVERRCKFFLTDCPALCNCDYPVSALSDMTQANECRSNLIVRKYCLLDRSSLDEHGQCRNKRETVNPLRCVHFT